MNVKQQFKNRVLALAHANNTNNNINKEFGILAIEQAILMCMGGQSILLSMENDDTIFGLNKSEIEIDNGFPRVKKKMFESGKIPVTTLESIEFVNGENRDPFKINLEYFNQMIQRDQTSVSAKKFYISRLLNTIIKKLTEPNAKIALIGLLYILLPGNKHDKTIMRNTRKVSKHKNKNKSKRRYQRSIVDRKFTEGYGLIDSSYFKVTIETQSSNNKNKTTETEFLFEEGAVTESTVTGGRKKKTIRRKKVTLKALKTKKKTIKKKITKAKIAVKKATMKKKKLQKKC